MQEIALHPSHAALAIPSWHPCPARGEEVGICFMLVHMVGEQKGQEQGKETQEKAGGYLHLDPPCPLEKAGWGW